MLPSVYSEIFGQMSVPIVVSELDGSPVWANHAFFAFASCSPDELNDIYIPGNAETSVETYVTVRGGQKIPVALSTSEVTLSDNTDCLIHVLYPKEDSDISASVNTELAKVREELEQFMYVISHDLQAPLRTIASYIQLIRKSIESGQTDRAFEFMGFVSEGVDKLQLLIENILKLSRIGTKGNSFMPVDLETIVKVSLAGLSEMIKTTNAKVTFDPLPVVTGDSVQLKMLIEQLLDNAIKFVRADAEPYVHISVEASGSQYLFAVKDNGIGIEQKYFERVFMIFQKLHSPTEYPGIGAGLTICKKIVERHGGKIWLESVPGNGTTVYFTLLK